MTTTVMIPVLMAGIIILKNDRNTPHPSILAASSRDVGTLLKYGRNVTTMKGTVPDAIASAGP